MAASDFLMLGLLMIATWSDLLSRKIPNGLIVVGLCLGLGVSNVSSGLEGAFGSLSGAMAGLLLFLPFFALRWMGAGDVKLLAMAGSFAGVPAIFLIALYSAVAGGALGVTSQFLVRLGWLAGTRASECGPSRSSARRGIAATAWRRFSSASLQLPYAVAILFGACIWIATRGA